MDHPLDLPLYNVQRLMVWLPVSSHFTNIVQRNAFRGPFSKTHWRVADTGAARRAVTSHLTTTLRAIEPENK